jgi:Tol biopolymer transport system component
VTNRLAVETGDPLASQLSIIEPPFPGDGEPARSQLTFSVASDSTPDWSPDGKRLVFGRENPLSELSAVWVVATDGSPARRLTRSRHAWVPVWSPDGRRIAYVLERRKKPAVLYLMRANGSHKRPVTSRVAPDRLSWQPLPTGTRLRAR